MLLSIAATVFTARACVKRLDVMQWPKTHRSETETL